MRMRKCHKVFVLAAIGVMLAGMCLVTTGCLSAHIFHTLAIEPNDQKNEFGREGELHEGSYLGTEIRQGRKMHHYCFAGILKGEGRKLHVCIDADGYGRAVAFEDDTCDLPEMAPAYLFFGVSPNYPRGIALLAERIQELSVPGDHPAVLCADRYDTICVFLPGDMSENGIGDKTWEGPMDVDWKVRSKAMSYVRPLYALPVALLCLPIDLIGGVLILPFLPYLMFDAANC